MAESGEALPAIEWQHCFPAEKAADAGGPGGAAAASAAAEDRFALLALYCRICLLRKLPRPRAQPEDEEEKGLALEVATIVEEGGGRG